MKCDGARELFSGYIENSLDAPLSALVQGHVAGCAACRADLEQVRNLWLTADALPDIAPPVDFRHNVVMQAARLQHEKAQLRAGRWSLASVARRLVPARAATVAWVVFALVVVVFGKQMYTDARNHAESMVGINTMPVVTQDAPSNDGESDYSTIGSQPGPKLDWQSRKLGRNTLWVSVDPKVNRDGRMIYRVTLSINPHALLERDTCERIGAQVHLLPGGQYGLQGRRGVNTVWRGSVLSDAPIVVPVIVDRSQGSDLSVNLLVEWKFRGRSFAQIVYLPSRYRGSLSRNMYDLSMDSRELMRNGSDLYGSLQNVAEDYGVIIIANARIPGEPEIVMPGRGDLDWVLRSTLKPAGLDWVMADCAIYIDREYH